MSWLHLECGIDLAVHGSLTITINEDSGGNTPVVLSSGKYFLAASGADTGLSGGDAGPAALVDTVYGVLIDDVAAALTAAGTGTYTCTFSRTTERVTITATGISTLDISFDSQAQLALGYDATTHTGSLSYGGDLVPGYFMSGAIGVWSNRRPLMEDQDVARTLYAHDGTPGGVTRTVSPKFERFDFAHEPRAAVYRRHVSPAGWWCWESTFEHLRNEWPFALVSSGGEEYYYLLTEDGAKFSPQLLAENYEAYLDIPIRAQFLGWA